MLVETWSFRSYVLSVSRYVSLCWKCCGAASRAQELPLTSGAFRLAGSSDLQGDRRVLTSPSLLATTGGSALDFSPCASSDTVGNTSGQCDVVTEVCRTAVDRDHVSSMLML